MSASGSMSSSMKRSSRLGRSPLVDFFLREVPIFSLLGTIEANQPYNFVVVGLLITFFQHLAFVINPHFGSTWRYIFGEGVAEAFFAFHFAIFDPALTSSASPTVAFVLLSILLALALFFCFVVLYYKIFSADTDKQHEAFVYVNRGVIHAISTILLIPSLRLSFGVLVCTSESRIGLLPDHECWTGEHIGLFIMGAAYALFVLPVAYMVLICQYDANPRSEHLRARSHTRVDELAFAHAISSCFLFAVMVPYGHAGGFALLNGVGSFFVAAAYVVYLPHFNMTMNRFFVTLHVLETFASATCAAVTLIESARVASVAPVLFLGLAPLVALIAWVVAPCRVSPTFEHAMQLAALGLPFGDGEEVLRAIHGLPVTERFSRPSLYGIDSLLADAQLKTMSDAASVSSVSKRTRTYPAVVEPMISRVRRASDVDLAARFCTAYVRTVRQQPGFSMIIAAVHIFVRGSIRFPFSGALLLAFARYICDYIPALGSTGIQLIEDMPRCDGGLSTRYCTYLLTDDLRAAVGIKSQSHLLHAEAARTMHCKVLTHMNAFWMKLTEPSVNIGQVSSIADDITESRKRALVQFRRAIQHQTNPDPQLIARMGAFLNDVMLDAEGAAECYNEAREVHEARQARSMRGTRQHTAMLDNEALTTHLLELLNQRNSESGSAKGSSVVRNLLFNVTAVFVVILGMASAMLYVSVTLHSENVRSIDRSEGAGFLRVAPQRFVSAMLSAQLYNDSASSFAKMSDEAQLFSEHFGHLSSGDERTTSAGILAQTAEERVPLLARTSASERAVSLWNVGEQIKAAFLGVLGANSTLTAAAGFLRDVSGDAAVVFDELMQLGYAEHDLMSMRTVQLLISVFVVALCAIAAVYVAFLVSFQRTQLGRVFTFQLFTLIPFDALEKLATETRDKINVMVAEESKRNAATAAANNGGVAGGDQGSNSDDGNRLALGGSEGSGVRSHSLSTSTDRSGAGSRLQSISASSPLQLNATSCLRRPNAPPRRVGLKVTISSTVTVFGNSSSAAGVDDKGPKNSAGADGGKDATLMEEEEEAQAHAIAKPREVTRGEAFGWLRLSLVLVVFAVLALLIIAIVFAALAMTSIDPTVDVHREALGVRDDFHALRLRVAALQDSLLEFLQTRNIAAGQDYFDARGLDDAAILESLRLKFPPSEADALVAVRSSLEELLQRHDHALSAFAQSEGATESIELVEQIRGFVNLTRRDQLLAAESAAVGTVQRRSNGTLAVGSAEFFRELSVAIVTHDSVTALLHAIWNRQAVVANAAAARILGTRKEAYLTYAYCVVGFAGAALLVALLLACVDVSWWSKGAHNSLSWVMQTAASAIPVAVVIAFIVAASSLSSAIDDRERHHISLIDAQFDIGRLTQAGKAFVVAAESHYWYEFSESVDEMPLHKLVDLAVGDGAAAGLAKLVKEASESYDEVLRLHQVANSIAMSAANATGSLAIERDMQRAFDATFWNFAAEPDYREVVQRHPGRQLHYTTRSADLVLAPAVRRRLAVATVFDSRYRVAVRKLRRAVQKIVDKADVEEASRLDAKTRRLRGVLIALLALLGLPIIVSFVNAAQLSGIVLHFLGLSASASTNTLDTSLYAKLLRRCRWSLLVIASLFCVVFGVSVWSTSISREPIRWLDLAARRDFHVISSLLHLQQLEVEGRAAHSFVQIERDAKALAAARSELAFGSVADGRHNAAGVDAAYDTNVYGTDDYLARERATLTYYRTMCGAVSSAPVVLERGPFYGLPFPVESFLHFWHGALLEIVTLARLDSADSADKIRAIAAELRRLEPEMILALRASTQELRSTAVSQSETIGSVLIAISSLLIAAIVGIYAFVFYPMVRRLVEEEESARLLLRMIPLQVRDQVPAISEFIETGRIDNAAELQKKFEASEKLLQNILPHKIAARLKAGESPIADMHPSLTILFTDFVGFTKRSSTMQADEIVDFLNEVFLDFDLIVDLLELEKIKTIGDAFFMCGGLDPRISDHALRVVEAGIMMFQSLAEHNERHPSRPLLRMRLGIHTGPAVAGVIGTKKVAYDLWGESVEIANAMESTAVPNRVHISETTAEFVSPFFALEPRGELPREKESIPDNMPKTYLVGQRLQASPYQHIFRPRLFKQRIGGGSTGKTQ